MAAKILAEFEDMASLSEQLGHLLASLTPRETEILNSIAAGDTMEQVATKLEAQSAIDLKATGTLTLKGAQASLEGDAMAGVKSNTAVQIQSSALVKVQGNPIMLN